VEVHRVSSSLRDRLGHEATLGLVTLLDHHEQVWREDVLSVAAERFEHGLATMSERFDRRLSEEIAALRVALTKEIHERHSDALRWAFLFWIGQFAAFVGLFTLMQRTLVR
jgi:hypothetical protein